MSEVKKARYYRDLLVWQKGIQLAKLIYQLTKSFPADERFGLVSQMRRAAVSVPSNIAEGQARHTTGEFVQSISHAEGSLAELDTQIVLALEFKYCRPADAETVSELIQELRRMLNGLRRNLITRHSSPVTR
jgi:four helix bundle protein